MNTGLIRVLLIGKLRDRSTYTLALIVGTLINVYGQLLVPWLRGIDQPLREFGREFDRHPTLTIVSVLLGYLFPLCVGTYSAVAARYKNRRLESIADFPDRKPDPVFRVDQSGRLLEAGLITRRFLEQYNLRTAQQVLGEDFWRRIVAGESQSFGESIRLNCDGKRYVVSHATTPGGDINIYMARLPK